MELHMHNVTTTRAVVEEVRDDVACRDHDVVTISIAGSGMSGYTNEMMSVRLFCDVGVGHALVASIGDADVVQRGAASTEDDAA